MESVRQPIDDRRGDRNADHSPGDYWSCSRNRATLWANGNPSAKSTLTFYRSVAGKDPILRTMTSNTAGNGKTTVKLPKGTRSVYVIYKAPGTGTSKTMKIKVK